MAEEIISTFFEVPVRDGGKVDATHIDLLLTHKASEARIIRANGIGVGC